MTTLTEGAQSDLERYLSQVRTALRGHRSVDTAEVERDVREHVAAELAGLAYLSFAGFVLAVLLFFVEPVLWPLPPVLLLASV